MTQLASTAEERAQRLHRDSLVMICHDHNLFPEDLEAMRRGGVTAKQVHICLDALIWADHDTFLASADLEEGYLRRALVALDYLYSQVERSKDRVVIALEPDHIFKAKEQDKIALLIGAEGPRLIENRLEVLRMLHRLGLRHLQLSWAWETTVGAPQGDTSGRGLTEFGRELIREMNGLGIIVDVSHLAYQSIYDALETSTTPILNSHTGAKTLNPGKAQLLPDELIRAMAARGGVLGIHFMSPVVKPGPQKATFAELMAQFEYVANLVGTDHIACGPDYLYSDPRLWENQGVSHPYSYAEGVEDISQMENVTRGLVACGFSDEDIRKIMGGNLLRLFQTVREAARSRRVSYIPRRGEIGVLTEGSTPL